MPIKQLAGWWSAVSFSWFEYRAREALQQLFCMGLKDYSARDGKENGNYGIVGWLYYMGPMLCASIPNNQSVTSTG